MAFDTREAGTAIEAQFPELSPVSVELLGEGYDSIAVAVNARWVFRFPKREEVERQLAVEWDLLRMLADAPLPVPRFQFEGRASDLFPRRFVGYSMLPGVPAILIDPATIPPAAGRSLGRFLSWLHARALDDARSAGVPDYGSGAVLAETAAEALEDLEWARKAGEGWPIETWRALVREPPAEDGRVVLAHADLAAEHLLFDAVRQEFTGVIDWSDCALVDPALDLAAAWHWADARLLEAVLGAYEGSTDEGLAQRARFFAACRGAGDIRFGLETRRPEYVTAGVRALRFCATRGQP
jgi:aminoglycoside phosphotransferase (APT) family kinase protein